jgi:hypothetical protein
MQLISLTNEQISNGLSGPLKWELVLGDQLSKDFVQHIIPNSKQAEAYFLKYNALHILTDRWGLLSDWVPDNLLPKTTECWGGWVQLNADRRAIVKYVGGWHDRQIQELFDLQIPLQTDVIPEIRDLHLVAQAGALGWPVKLSQEELYCDYLKEEDTLPAELILEVMNKKIYSKTREGFTTVTPFHRWLNSEPVWEIIKTNNRIEEFINRFQHELLERCAFLYRELPIHQLPGRLALIRVGSIRHVDRYNNKDFYGMRLDLATQTIRIDDDDYEDVMLSDSQMQTVMEVLQRFGEIDFNHDCPDEDSDIVECLTDRFKPLVTGQ